METSSAARAALADAGVFAEMPADPSVVDPHRILLAWVLQGPRPTWSGTAEPPAAPSTSGPPDCPVADDGRGCSAAPRQRTAGFAGAGYRFRRRVQRRPGAGRAGNNRTGRAAAFGCSSPTTRRWSAARWRPSCRWRPTWRWSPRSDEVTRWSKPHAAAARKSACSTSRCRGRRHRGRPQDRHRAPEVPLALVVTTFGRPATSGVRSMRARVGS